MTDRRGIGAVVAAACTWGTWRLWLTGPTLDPAAQGATVLTVAGLVTLALSRPDLTRLRTVPRSAWLWMLAFGVAEAANYLLYFGALAAGDSAAAAVTHYLAPLLVAAVGPLVGQAVPRRVFLAAPVAFAGTFAMVGIGDVSDATTRAALLGAGSAVFYAANVLIAKRLSTGFSALELVAFHNLLAAPVVWACSSTPPWVASGRELLLAVGGALVGGVFASTIYFWGLARIPAAQASVLAYLEPLSTALVGAALLGEPLGPVRGVAMLAVLGAGVFVALDRSPSRAPNVT